MQQQTYKMVINVRVVNGTMPPELVLHFLNEADDDLVIELVEATEVTPYKE